MTGRHTEKRPWWLDLRALAVGWMVLPLTLMLVLAVGVTSIAMQSIAKTLVEDRDLIVARVTAERLAADLEQYAQVLRVLSKQPAIVLLNVEQSAAVFDTYNDLLSGYVTGGGIILLDDTGRVVITYPSRPELLGQDYSSYPYFKNLAASPIDSSPYFDVLPEPGTKRQLVGVAVPVMDANNQFGGVLVGKFYLDVQHFGQYLWPLQQTENEQVFLLDHNGQVIFHTNPTLINDNFNEQPVVSAMQQSNRTTGVTIVQSADNGSVVAGYAPVGATGWELVIMQPWSQILLPLRGPIIFVAVIMFLGMVGLILVVLWAARRITQPLDRLVRQFRQVAAGDYDIQVQLSRISELRTLGVAFNHMVNQLESYRSGLQEYVASVTNSQEEERKRIARDLHDGTIQTLIAIGQRIELVRDMLPEQATEQSQQQLTELRIMVKEAIAGIRQFSRDLRPMALEDLGLIPALQYLVGRLEQQDGITAHLSIEGDAVGLPQDLEVAIFRITQETLSNIRKHARATAIYVTIKFLPRQTLLEVRDNGVGFDVPENTTDLARKGSFGLLGLQERANLFGGDISIQSARGQGTIVRVILPHKQIPRRPQNIPANYPDVQ